MFALIFLGLLGSVYGYSGWRLIPQLSASLHAAVALALGFPLILPLLLIFLRTRPRLARLSRLLSWTLYLGTGFATCSTTLLVLRDIAGLAVGHFVTISPALNARADLATFGLTIALAGWGFYQARRTPAIWRIDVPITNPPPALAGFRIAQFSDLHIGPTFKGGFVARVTDRNNGEKPNLIAFTGDPAELGAPLWVYFCTGNHDYYSGIEQWTDHACRLGFEVLVNEGHTHGRQFVPWNFAVHLQQPYVAGLQKLRNMWIYVHRGTDDCGPPLRLGVHSQVAPLTLTRTQTQ